jgi:cytochrome c-type biogenesis protein CcmE
VICNKQKPFDFERAEEVMLVGKMVDESTFIASDFQTKCPSKYENEINDIQGDTSNQVGQKY